MKERIAVRSREQGFEQSRLPVFNEEEIAFIRGSADFFGLNAYSTYGVYRNGSMPGYLDDQAFDYNILLGKYAVPSYADDLNVSVAVKDDFKPSLWMTVSNFYNGHEMRTLFA